MGFVLQHYSLINNRSVFYNIALPLKYRKISKEKIKEKTRQAANSLGVGDKLNQYPYVLSGGEAQRVSIARAIISNPSIILADEPTSSLDEENKNEVLSILRTLNREGITIIIATHDSTVAQACDRIVQIDLGRICDQN